MKIYLDDIRTPRNIPWYSKLWAFFCNLFRLKQFKCGGWIVCRTPETFKNAVGEWYCVLLNLSSYFLMEKFPYEGEKLELSLDHDLGPHPTETGYDLVKWLTEFIMDVTEKGNNELKLSINLVELIDIHVHSANPVGKKNIETLWESFKTFKLGGN